MKLFARVDRQEGEIIPTDIVFMWGTVHRHELYGDAADIDYWCFISPFTIRHTCIDYATFTLTKGPCRWAIIAQRDTSGKLNWRQGWIPYL